MQSKKWIHVINGNNDILDALSKDKKKKILIYIFHAIKETRAKHAIYAQNSKVKNVKFNLMS